MEGSLRHIALSDLGDSVGAAPSRFLVESIRLNGVLQPIALAETVNAHGEMSLTLIDGNRRLSAARECGSTTIPAIVFTGVDEELISTITLVLNGFRTSNYLSEFWAIKQLERSGVSDAHIRSISGLSATKVNQRKKLSNLKRELFVALRNGKIVQSYAMTISTLPTEKQQELAELFARKQKLQKSDVDKYVERRARSLPVASSEINQPYTRNRWEVLSEPNRVGDTAIRPTTTNVPAASTEIEPLPPAESAVDFKPQVNSPSDASLLDPPSLTMQVESRMRSAVAAAHVLELSKDEFLDMVSRMWDESIANHPTVGVNPPTADLPNAAERFPDLAAHKWDTGES